MKVLYFFFCYAHIPAQLRQKLAPRANRWFLKGHASAQNFDVLILLLVLAVPACYLPWARVLLLPLILVGAYWISIFWIFFTSGFSCASRASGGVKVPRKSGSQPSIEQPALAPRSSNNKEQPASLSSSSNDQLPTDYPSSSIAAEPSPSLRLNGSPRPCSKGKVLSLNRARDIRRKRMTRWKALFPPKKARIPYLFIGKSARPEEKYVSRNAMWIGSLSPHPASSSINIRFQKNFEAYSHFSLTPYSLLNKAMKKLE